MPAPTALHVAGGDGNNLRVSLDACVSSSYDALPDASQPQSSVWDCVPEGEPDAILSINAAFANDPHPHKVNLGVGAYRDEEGNPRTLEAVRLAELQLVNEIQPDKEYSAASGNEALCHLSACLLFGDEHPLVKRQCIATVQTISGTGALRLAGELLRHFRHDRPILLPDPSWALHQPLFEACDLHTQRYRYYHAPTRTLDVDGMLTDLSNAPYGSVVVLHACAHNPTGVDCSAEQWEAVLKVVQQRRLLPFFDVAYQGFASGDLSTDAYSLRLFGQASIEMLVAQSYAKNMGLYGERVGTLSVVCRDTARAGVVRSQLKQLARSLYSNPPRHGAEVAVLVLSQPALRAKWEAELAHMCERLLGVRQRLLQELQALGTPGNWSHITAQRGMFSFTGLTAQQVQRLRSTWHVYMTDDGRMALAALRTAQCAYVARAIHDVVVTMS